MGSDTDAVRARRLTLALGAALVLLALLLSASCASCPPCEPEIRVQRVEVPVPVHPHLAPLPPLRLPPWPAPPADDAPAEAWKTWYAAMAATVRERLALLQARLARLEEEREALRSQSSDPAATQ